MAVSSAAITVTTTPTLLTAGSPGRFTQSFAVRNTGTVVIYLGGSEVTTTAGFPLDPDESLGLDLENEHDELYAVVATGTSSVRVLGTAG